MTTEANKYAGHCEQGKHFFASLRTRVAPAFNAYVNRRLERHISALRQVKPRIAVVIIYTCWRGARSTVSGRLVSDRWLGSYA